jgi:FG-GAP repeat
MKFRHLTLAVTLFALAGCKSEPKRDAKPPVSPTPSASASAAPAKDADSRGVQRLPAKVKKGEELGYAVAADATRVVVTAWKREGPDDTHPGSIFVFQRSGGKVAFETELVAEGSHQIGDAVALTPDLVAAGAMFDDGAVKEAGAAYAFSREGSSWSKATKLVARGGKADESFGIGMAAAGQTLVVSNTREAGGSLFLYERGKTGVKLAQTVPYAETGGPAEAVSAFGDVIAVGAQYSGANEAGSVHLYARGEHGFKEETKLSESKPGENQHFGGGIAAGPDLVAVASEQRISVFSRKGGKWTESAAIEPPIKTSLADAGLAIDGHVLAVGLPRVDEGRVLLYREKNGEWKLDRTLAAPDGKKDDWFGYSLALAPKLLVIGAPLADERGGAVYTVEP